MEEILIDIGPNGDVKVEGVGIKGPDCVKLTAEIEAAIGSVQKRAQKAEFHQRPEILRKAGA